MVTEQSSPKKQKLPQLFLVAANAFSLIYAVEVGVLSIVLGISALVAGGKVSGVLAFIPFWLSLSAIAFGLIAFVTTKKISDKELLKKAYGVAAAFLFVEFVLAATATIAVPFYSLFAVGEGSIQSALWLNMFLPYLGLTAVVFGLLAVAKKISEGYTKILPTITYVIFGIAGIALILSMVATFVGLYGGSSNSNSYPT